MRTLREIEYDIDMVQREMSKLILAQSDMDDQLRNWDYRLRALEQEKRAKLATVDL